TGDGNRGGFNHKPRVLRDRDHIDRKETGMKTGNGHGNFDRIYRINGNTMDRMGTRTGGTEPRAAAGARPLRFEGANQGCADHFTRKEPAYSSASIAFNRLQPAFFRVF